MTYYPQAPEDPMWALFDADGLQRVWTVQDSGRTMAELEQDAFTVLNANRDQAGVYLVRCLWADPHDHGTFYEIGDRVSAPAGEESDRVPPE